MFLLRGYADYGGQANKSNKPLNERNKPMNKNINTVVELTEKELECVAGGMKVSRVLGASENFPHCSDCSIVRIEGFQRGQLVAY